MNSAYFQDDTTTLHLGDAATVLATLPDQSADCVVTSPPYFGLRDYGQDGQIGAEPTPAEFVAALVAVFREARRVLADDGCMFLNLGDSYVHKNLLGIPWRVAFALQDDDMSDIYELKDDAPTSVREAVYLETCHIRTQKNESATPVNTPNVGARPTLNVTRSAVPHGMRPTGTRLETTDVSTTNSTEKKRYSEPSEGTPAGTEGSDSKHSSVTQVNSLSAHVAKSGDLTSSHWTTRTEVEGNTGKSLGKSTSTSGNTSDARTTPMGSACSATTVTKRGVTTESVRTKKNKRPRILKADIPPGDLIWFKLVKEDRWILRSDIIWHKPNAMPESVTDRLANRHEHMFMFSKKPRYWFNLDPIREPHTSTPDRAGATALRGQAAIRPTGPNSGAYSEGGRNPGDVWTIATQPFPGAHFATFPPALPERCIQAGCKPGGTVLDPFSGSGTTGLAASRHGMRYVGIDLNRDYLDLSLRTRLAQGSLLTEATA